MIFHFTLAQILLLIPAGILAGIISSTVGMASLVSYPALLYIGRLPAVFANVTNTASMIFSGAGSGLSSIPELKGHVKQTLVTLLLTFFGSIGGSMLLLMEPSGSFQKIVPFFILISGIMILLTWPS
ncbi:MAG: sulfite exporter TauE/SafE family protein [Acetilactobacillus jinshanensis]